MFYPKNRLQYIGILCCYLIVLALAGCTKVPPKNPHNICAVFKEYPSWYWDAKKAYKKWGVPVHVQMAVIYQESRFNAKAKPPRTKLLWVIPWKRPTSAYGYSQAINGTWDNYKDKADNSWASRKNFADATDFISWYGDQAHKKLGISRWNAYEIYLAYHEGLGGYARRSYRKKPWLIKVARKVEARSNKFAAELRACQSKIKKPWWKF